MYRSILSNVMSVDSVLMNGALMAFAHEFALLTVTLDRIYPAGTSLAFIVYYHGVPDSQRIRELRCSLLTTVFPGSGH